MVELFNRALDGVDALTDPDAGFVHARDGLAGAFLDTFDLAVDVGGGLLGLLGK